MTAVEFLLTAACVVFAYAVLSRGLFLATEGARQSLIDLASKLIESPAIHDKEKQEIRDLLLTVHSSLCAWLLLLSAIVALVSMPFAKLRNGTSIPPMLRETHDKFVSRWVVATMGNSLTAAIIFGFVYLIAAALHVSFYMLGRSVISMRRHHRHGDHAPA